MLIKVTLLKSCENRDPDTVIIGVNHIATITKSCDSYSWENNKLFDTSLIRLVSGGVFEVVESFGEILAQATPRVPMDLSYYTGSTKKME